MIQDKLPTIGLLWGQFAAYHIDRCEAVARQLAGRFHVRAVEVATRSHDYAWDASGNIDGAEKRTLFPGQAFEAVCWPRRLLACWRALRGCDSVFMGLPYSLPEAIILSWALRLSGVRVIMMTESKHDDRPRTRWKEAVKGQLLRAYDAALVGAHRQAAYCRTLGFAGRRIEPGYDTVSVARIRALAGQGSTQASAFADRPVLFVGRFVEKKDPLGVLRAYAHYLSLSGQPARRLVMAGDGPLAPTLKLEAQRLGISDRVDFPGFLNSSQISQQMARALLLLLPSREEQWGLVINEALAAGLPVIASSAVGACDALVRHGLNGYVVTAGADIETGAAIARISADQAGWEAMAQASAALAMTGDVGHFADAVEILLDPGDQALASRVAEFREAAGMDQQ